MTDDIVARLRLYANASIDGGWASVFRADLNIAADEIERLRRDYSCICGQMRRMMEERDAARRMYCEELSLRAFGDTSCAWEEASIRSWDCFKENTE